MTNLPVTKLRDTRRRPGLFADWGGVLEGGWRSRQILLLVFAAASPIAFETWSVLINNFVVEKAGFTGREIGLLQGLREVPGFLAFTVVFMLLVWRQQTFAILALAVMGVGVALVGFLPSVWGIYFTTVIMSIGFHYLATMEQSLAMQWTSPRELPVLLGRMRAVAALASLATYGLVFGALTLLELSYLQVFLAGGLVTIGIAAVCRFGFPRFRNPVHQSTAIVLRPRYWLYYALEFLSGARRQIFIVFAAFMMVEKFGYGAEDITLLFLANCLLSIWVAPRVGTLIARWGERPALVLEYAGLIGVFTAYAFVETAWLAAGLYIVDHLFFALAIAIQSYFRKNRGPRGLRFDGRGVVHDQSHCRRRPAADPRSRVGDGVRRDAPPCSSSGRASRPARSSSPCSCRTRRPPGARAWDGRARRRAAA